MKRIDFLKEVKKMDDIYTCMENKIFINIGKLLYIEVESNGAPSGDYIVTVTQQGDARDKGIFRINLIKLEDLLIIIKKIKFNKERSRSLFEKVCFLLINSKLEIVAGLNHFLLDGDKNANT